VVHTGFAQFLTQLGVIGHADAVVSNDNTSQRRSDLLVQGLDKSLLGFQNLCTGHLNFTSFHLQFGNGKRAFRVNEKAPFPSPGKGLDSTAIKRTFLGRWVSPLCLAAPAVLKTAQLV